MHLHHVKCYYREETKSLTGKEDPEYSLESSGLSLGNGPGCDPEFSFIPSALTRAKSTNPAQRTGAEFYSGITDYSPGGAPEWDFPVSA